MKTTSFFELPTPNICRAVAVLVLTWAMAGDLGAASFPELTAATRPMEEGIPQVSVLRLRALLARDLGIEERLETMARL